MKPSERRAAMKSEMAARHQESYNSKDDSGKFKSIFNKGAIGSTPMWKCSEDEHFINIIPYIAGDKNPNVKAGSFAYNLDVYVHRKVGINEDSYICLSRTYGQPCPICEHQAELRKSDDYDEKYVKDLNPTRRVIYNIECLDSDKEVAKGIQLFEVSHWLFEKEVAEIAKKPRGGGFILFSDPDEGKTLFFRKSGSGATNTEYKAFKFEDRDAPVPDELLDKALCLDELIHVPTYLEVKNAFFGNEVDEGERTVDEGKVEKEQESRRPVTRGTVEPAKEEAAPATEEFTGCPGEAPADYGKFEACNICPDVAECEKEFNVVAEAEAAEAARIAAEKTAAEKAAPAAEPRRRLGQAPAPAEKAAEPAAAAAPAAGDSERRVRRRPGQ